jgi:hypothetical protein
LAVGSDGSVYVSDVNAGAVVLLKDGKIEDVIHIPGRPHALGLDVAANEIYVASTEPMKPNVIQVVRKKAPSNWQGRTQTAGASLTFTRIFPENKT